MSGYLNQVTSHHSAVLGGQSNIVSGSHAAIAGGFGLTLGGYSFGFNGYTNPANLPDLSGQGNIAYLGDVNLWIGNVNNAAKEIRFYEPNTSLTYTGTNYTAFKAGVQAANLTYTLPLVAPLANQVLASDASGSLSWANMSSSAWNITGNASTVDGTNFIGTTDNIPLSMRVNNQKAGRIDAVGVTTLGYQAANVNTATNITAIGFQAGFANITGTGNTFMGYTADASTTNLSNAMALGNGAVVDASNKIRLGNSSVTLVETSGSFVTVSDRRLKTNIENNALGLNFIKAIRPVQYELKTQKGIVYDGFIAQEIEDILKKQNIQHFSGLAKPNTSDKEGGYYSVSYATFVVPLVNAVKEIDAKNEKLEIENTLLKQEVEKMKAQNTALKTSVDMNTRAIEEIKAELSKKQK